MLDRLLEDGRIDVEGISGTSARSLDVVIVHINPTESSVVPRSSGDITNRVNEISFNALLIEELRAVFFVQTLMDDGSSRRSCLAIAGGNLLRNGSIQA